MPLGGEDTGGDYGGPVPKRIRRRILIANRKNESKAVVQIDPSEAECLEIRILCDPDEVVVLRHGMAYPDGGECVYSELLHIDPRSQSDYEAFGG